MYLFPSLFIILDDMMILKITHRILFSNKNFFIKAVSMIQLIFTGETKSHQSRTGEANDGT